MRVGELSIPPTRSALCQLSQQFSCRFSCLTLAQRLFFRYERLEEQLNDLTELHQNEMTNLKQELASMEEKVAYQSYERARDIQVKTGLGRTPAPACPLLPAPR